MGDVRHLVCASLLLTACASEPTAAEKEAQERRDIAAVEAVQKMRPPPQMVAPRPILFPDIAKNDLFGAGCAFAPGGSIGAVLLTQPKAAYIKLEDRVIRLASDPGSASMPLGTWSRYAGTDYSVSLTKAAGEGEGEGSESVRWDGHLTISDAFEQVVYDADGMVQCGS